MIDRQHETEAEEKERLSEAILRAYIKHGAAQEPTMLDGDTWADALGIALGADVDILWSNSRIVALTSSNYDGTVFAVVDLKTQELVMQSTDSDWLMNYFDQDTLQVYKPFPEEKA